MVDTTSSFVHEIFQYINSNILNQSKLSNQHTRKKKLHIFYIIPDFSLLDTKTNQLLSLNELRGNKGTLIFFICNHCPYVIHIETKFVELAQHYQQQGIAVIAISANAVLHANKLLDTWPNAITYLAVGQASTDAFSDININSRCPDEATSEGLLSMPVLSDVKDKKIVILRGEGGRETLAQQLVKRGAKVNYSQLYRRQSIVSNKENDLLKWQQLKITIIVVTSAETLLTLVARVKGSDLQWLQRCTIIVPSLRVAKIADENGLTHVEISAGASNQAILQQLLTLQSSSNEK